CPPIITPAVLTAIVVEPAPPFAFIAGNTRARPAEARALLREVANRVNASRMASEVVCCSRYSRAPERIAATIVRGLFISPTANIAISLRSEEHTSELQSHLTLVCRLLL